MKCKCDSIGVSIIHNVIRSNINLSLMYSIFTLLIFPIVSGVRMTRNPFEYHGYRGLGRVFENGTMAPRSMVHVGTHISEEHYKNYTKKGVIIPAEDLNYTATLVFLNGPGNATDHWARQIGNFCEPYMKVICPIINAFPVYWKNISKIEQNWSDGHPNSTEDLRNSTQYIQKIIRMEMKQGTSHERIFVGGFAQGSAVAIQVALSFPEKLAGILTISPWVLPMGKSFADSINPVNKDIPIFQYYGEPDPIVPHHVAKSTVTDLQTISNNVVLKTYKGTEHGVVSKEGMKDICKFLKSYAPPIDDT